MTQMTAAALRGAGALGLLGAASALGAVGCGAATVIRPKTAPAAAMVVPDFTLPSTLGGQLAFAEVTQRTATVLVFYRGFW